LLYEAGNGKLFTVYEVEHMAMPQRKALNYPSGDGASKRLCFKQPLLMMRERKRCTGNSGL
jgi:hypothetical protein